MSSKLLKNFSALEHASVVIAYTHTHLHLLTPTHTHAHAAFMPKAASLDEFPCVHKMDEEYWHFQA